MLDEHVLDEYTKPDGKRHRVFFYHQYWAVLPRVDKMADVNGIIGK